MTEHRTWRERLLNQVFAIPAVAQWWAKQSATQTNQVVELTGDIPFTPLSRPLNQLRLALVTTAGLHLPSQPAFDMENPDGDVTFREIPDATPLSELTITHKYYDHTDADSDPNIVFPLERLHGLVQEGIIGATAPCHFSFMGHIDGPLCDQLVRNSAPAVAGMLKQDQVDAVLLTPA
jgi:D-proline reductase (dithiol) PrdB